jgi:hypothetical protein
MSRNQISFIVIVFLALAWAIVKSREPSGGSIPWFLGFLLLALLNYYYGFVDGGFNPFRFYAKAGFLIFLALALLMAYVARIEDDGLSKIAEYVAVYPRLEELHFVPRTSDKTIQHWQIKSGDSVTDIKKFYLNRKNLRNWEIIRNEPVLVLEKDNMRLTITIGEQPRSPLSIVFYHLESI